MRTVRSLFVGLMAALCLTACEYFPMPPAEPTIEALRTPEERFEGLVDYPFEPNYVTVMPGNLRMHYIDEGPADGKTVLLLHGNPAWTYVLRDVIPVLVDQGYRVIAPDLIGFGKSDKPVSRTVQTYDNQEAWVTNFIETLNLHDINLHVQDWGGLIGLRVAIRNEARFATVAASNTALPTGELETPAFQFWRDSLSQVVPSYGAILELATFTTLTPEEQAAYDAPFPSEEYKAGPRELPLRVPVDTNDPEAIENQELLEQWANWEKPFLALYSVNDGITTGFDQILINTIPGADGQPHTKIPETSHFIREDAPVEIATRLIDFIESTQ